MTFSAAKKALRPQAEATPRRSAERFSDAPGTLRERGGRLYLICADGAVEIVSLQASGKKRMDADVFLRGCPLDGKRVC